MYYWIILNIPGEYDWRRESIWKTSVCLGKSAILGCVLTKYGKRMNENPRVPESRLKELSKLCVRVPDSGLRNPHISLLHFVWEERLEKMDIIELMM